MQITAAAMLPQYFRVILGPLEEMYFRQQQARASPARPNLPGPSEHGIGMAATTGTLIGQKRKAGKALVIVGLLVFEAELTHDTRTILNF